MEHTEEPSYLDLLPHELREKVALNILPEVPVIHPGVTEDEDIAAHEEVIKDANRWIKNNLDEYLYGSYGGPESHGGIMYRDGDPAWARLKGQGPITRRVLEANYKFRKAAEDRIQAIKAIPIVKHIRKPRNRSVLKKH